MRKLGDKARDRVRRLLVGVNKEEREEIEARAEAAGLTMSAYLRSAALGHPIRAKADLEAVALLARVNATQTRLIDGLVEYGATGLIQQIRASQIDLTAALGKLER